MWYNNDMYDKQIILFDMDGTINESSEGIVNAVLYALERMEVKNIDKNNIKQRVVGPPIRKIFTDSFGLNKDKAIQAHELYREYLGRRGIYENRVYPGVEDLLRKLKTQGKRVMLATSKWTTFAEQILRHFNLIQYFDFIGGSEIDYRTSKAEVIQYVMEKCGVKEKDRAVMVGDRSYDILGAAENGVEGIGVLYGYGSKEELLACKPAYIVKSIKELTKLLCNNT
jgi:phosphoglycolate phosphatase